MPLKFRIASLMSGMHSDSSIEWLAVFVELPEGQELLPAGKAPSCL